MCESNEHEISTTDCALEREKHTSNLFEESEKLINIENELSAKLETLHFKSPVEYVYNPLKYASDVHNKFIKKYFENCSKKIMFLGINPGPWGMCQTGIVFGEKDYVKQWFQITGQINKPEREHPKKKVAGFDCHRSEISGKRFWDFFKRICKTPENFFRHSFIFNLCPLCFIESSGKNITPPEIKDINLKERLNKICDEAFIKIIKEFQFEIVIGIGQFAEKGAIKALKTNGITSVKVYRIPHPSLRNAKDKKDWEKKTFAILKQHKLLKCFNDEACGETLEEFSA